jgi:serine/threonine-protein phosphatase 6 regulatory ankyrin repeat subunit B
LLAAKADVNAKLGDGSTALWHASENRRLEVVQALLAAGAGMHAKNSSGKTALVAASLGGVPSSPLSATHGTT